MINSERHYFGPERRAHERRGIRINWKVKVAMVLLAGFWTGLVYLHWLLSQCQI
jgi:hypothetical protein